MRQDTSTQEPKNIYIVRITPAYSVCPRMQSVYGVEETKIQDVFWELKGYTFNAFWHYAFEMKEPAS